MKKIFSLLIIFALFFILNVEDKITAFSKKKQTSNEIKIVIPTGFPAISMAELISGGMQFDKNIKTVYEVIESPDLMAARVISGEADIAIVPTNLSAKLYNKNVDIKLAGSVVWGILYLAASEEIKEWKDLKGKEIYAIGRGLTPDIVFRYLLTANGLDSEKDVKIKYMEGIAELSASFIAGKSSIVVIPEPALSMVLTKKPNTKIVMDLQKEWAAVSGNSMSYPQASLIIKNDVIKNNPDYVKSFLEKISESIEMLKNDPEKAGKLTGAFLKTPPPLIITKSLHRGNLKWVKGKDAKNAIEKYLEVLLKFSPESIGGKLPDEKFYF